jgi:hypothetical protein
MEQLTVPVGVSLKNFLLGRPGAGISPVRGVKQLWYLLWLVPFLGAGSTAPLAVWSVSILLTYSVWYLERFGHRWQVPGWIMLLEYGSVLLAAAIVLLQRTLTNGKASYRGGVCGD